MPTDRERCILLSLVLVAAVLLLDQASKWQMLNALVEHREITVTPFFNLALVWNYGISFGMLAGQRATSGLITLSALIMLVLLVWLLRNTSLLTACALGLVIGGAAGNVIDRLRYGAVVDFLDFHLGNYHWPAFNAADSAIFIGVVLLCASSMFSQSS